MSAYAQLEASFREIGVARSIIGTLNWDRYAMMPGGSTRLRGEQLALLERWTGARLTDANLDRLLSEAVTEPLTGAQRANIREMLRERSRSCSLSTSLADALTRAGLACEARWREAREHNDFARVRGAFHELLQLTREAAAQQADALAIPPYDALLERHEPGLSGDDLNALIEGMMSWLPSMAQQIPTRASSRTPDVPLALQRDTLPKLLIAIGFDVDHGLIAESLQPCFSDDTPDDVRITLAYDVEQPLATLQGALHEMGHSFYERQCAPCWRYQPAGRPRSGGMQESQALVWEQHVAASPGFVQWLSPHLERRFGWTVGPSEIASAWHVHDLTKGRFDSGEIGYLLHVILRIHVEQRLVIGNLSARDLPEAWEAAEHQFLGRTSSKPAVACLADIHWYRGLFGYFPSYLTGATMAAQLMNAAHRARPNLDDEFARGEFAPLIEWLNCKVHQHGSLKSSDEILRGATGQSLSDKALRMHLHKRYLENVRDAC
jgi:carboxypeptidase Taq